MVNKSIEFINNNRVVKSLVENSLKKDPNKSGLIALGLIHRLGAKINFGETSNYSELLEKVKDPERKEFLRSLIRNTEDEKASIEVGWILSGVGETNKDAHSFAEKAFPLAYEMLITAKSYSVQEYYAITLVQAITASLEGNFGIGAVYVIRQGDEEFIILGRNQMSSKQDSSGHAEMVAIDRFEAIERGEWDESSEKFILRRKSPNNEESKEMLFTLLEPCPMCESRIVSHSLIDEVHSATQDKDGAHYLGIRYLHTPSTWRLLHDKVNHTKKYLGSFTNPESQDYIPPKYRDVLEQVFEASKDETNLRLHEIHNAGRVVETIHAHITK